MSKRSLLTGLMVIAVWLVTMGFLVKNYYLYPEPAPVFDNADLFSSVQPVKKWQDVKEYMVIRQNGKSIGATYTEVKRGDLDTSASYLTNFRMTAKLSPLLPSINVKVVANLTNDYNLSAFHAVGDIGGLNMTATGHTNEKLLYITLAKQNNINNKILLLDKPVSLAESIRPVLGRQIDIKPGARQTVPVIDPLNGRAKGSLDIKVMDEEFVKVNRQDVMAYKVVSSLGDIKTTMWVDKDGTTVKRQLVGNMVMERAKVEEVKSFLEDTDAKLEIPPFQKSDFEGIKVSKPETEESGMLGGLEILL